MAWIYLLTAGAMEVVWASGLKRLSDGFSLVLLIVTVVAMIASIVALYAAMTRLPLGIAYPVWTGIGAVGSVIVSVVAFNQTLTATSILGLLLLVAGMALLGANAH